MLKIVTKLKKTSKIKDLIKFSLFIKQCYGITWSVEKKTESKNPIVAR